MDEISFFFFSLSWIAIVKQAYIHYSSIISTIRERYIYIYIFRSISREYRSSSVQGESKRNISSPELRETIIPPPLFLFLFFPPFTTSHLIQPQNRTLIIPRLPIQIQPRRHITFPPIRPIIRTIPIPRIRLQPLQFQRRRCRFNHGELLKREHNRGGFVGREELDRGPVFRC